MAPQSVAVAPKPEVLADGEAAKDQLEVPCTIFEKLCKSLKARDQVLLDEKYVAPAGAGKLL